MERHRLTIGKGGWVRFMSSDLPAAVYLRYEDRDGRLVATETYVETLDGQPLTGELVRRVPFGSIDSGVNAQADAVREGMNFPGPLLRHAARWGFPGSRARAPRPGKLNHWLKRMYDSQVSTDPEPEAPLRPLEPLEPVEPPELNATLDVPSAKPYGNDFYQQVAEVYRRVAPWHRSPASLIAEDNKVPVSTAHRWIKIARQQGHLPPGRRVKGA